MKKNALVTGAAGNLGKAVVDKFLSIGYRVAAIASAGRSGGPGTTGVEVWNADLTNELEAESVIKAVFTKYESIDVALLLVGGFIAGGVKETDGASLRKMYSLNFETAYFCARPIFLQMLAQNGGGKIILVGSRPSLESKDGKHALAYALAKSLVFKLAEILNAEGEAHGVVTSVVVPSTIDTPVNRKSMPNADFSKWVKPDDIAAVMEFIATNDSLRNPVYKVYGES